MNKAEQFFNTVDFSVETDFKERLRKQLFESSEGSISEQSLQDDSADVNKVDVNKVDVRKRKDSARELSFDELELIHAAGNIAMQGQTLTNRAKSKPIQDKTGQDHWAKPFSGIIAEHDVE